MNLKKARLEKIMLITKKNIIIGITILASIYVAKLIVDKLENKENSNLDDETKLNIFMKALNDHNIKLKGHYVLNSFNSGNKTAYKVVYGILSESEKNKLRGWIKNLDDKISKYENSKEIENIKYLNTLKRSKSTLIKCYKIVN